MLSEVGQKACNRRAKILVKGGGERNFLIEARGYNRGAAFKLFRARVGSEPVFLAPRGSVNPRGGIKEQRLKCEFPSHKVFRNHQTRDEGPLV